MFEFCCPRYDFPFPSAEDLKVIKKRAEIFFQQSVSSDRVISVILSEEQEIIDLNFTFRNLKQPTDVLSWAYEPEFPEEPLGEIAICAAICHRQAQENGWDFKTEFLRLLVHGSAHILGYDHQTIEEEQAMLMIEKNMLEIIDLPHIYGLS